MTGEARVVASRLQGLREADRIRGLDLEAARKGFSHDLLPVEEGDACSGGLADDHRPADGRGTTQSDFALLTEDSGH
jgi:hypothetical protein